MHIMYVFVIPGVPLSTLGDTYTDVTKHLHISMHAVMLNYSYSYIPIAVAIYTCIHNCMALYTFDIIRCV